MGSNLTPLDTSKTVRHPGPRGLETWEAFSADGQYAYIRFEDEGTTWQVKYLPAGFLFEDFFGSLGAARKWTASSNPTPLVESTRGALGALMVASVAMPETVQRAAEYEARQLKDRLAGDTEQDCDYCGPGRPCTCEADSTDPIENIYD